jgi:putative membrane protein
MRKIVTSLSVLTLAVGSAFAQDAPRDPNARQGLSIQAPGVDIQVGGDSNNQEKSAPITAREFVLKASGGGMAEVQAGNLARRKGSSEEIKTFAEQMIADHTKANEELKSLASSKNLPVAAEPAPKDKQAIQALSATEASAFDRLYANQQVQAHVETVALFERAANTLPDDELKAWAGKTLPTLQHHLAMARKLAGGDHREPASTTPHAPAGVTNPANPTSRPIR